MSLPLGTIVYDGDCGFCMASARWIERRLGDDVSVEKWQSLDLDAIGLTIDDVTTASYFVAPDGSLHRGAPGIGQVFERMSLPYRVVGMLMKRPPVSWVASVVYATVARYRHKLPGATDECRV